MINPWAVLLAAASSFALGGLWYSPAVFGRLWNRENGSAPQAGHPARVFGVAFAFSLASAGFFALLLGPKPSLGRALAQGALAGFGFVAASFGVNYQFAQRTLALWAIDGGYHTTQFLLFGLVLGLWH